MPAPFALTLVVAGCATPASPSTCTNLQGVRAVLIENAAGEPRVRYTYANDDLRLRHLQCRVNFGEKVAVVQLAHVYEMGSGLPQDESRAAALYEMAAIDRPAYTSIYSPPVTIGGAGRVMMLPNPHGGPGDPEAKYRLGRMLIEGRGIAMDQRRGQALVDAALRGGFQP